MTEPLRALVTARAGDATLDVAQVDADHVSVLVAIDDRVNVAKLTSAQAVELALSILLGNPEALSRVAERLDDQTCAELGMALLAVPAARALARKAAESGRAH